MRFYSYFEEKYWINYCTTPIAKCERTVDIYVCIIDLILLCPNTHDLSALLRCCVSLGFYWPPVCRAKGIKSYIMWKMASKRLDASSAAYEVTASSSACVLTVIVNSDTRTVYHKTSGKRAYNMEAIHRAVKLSGSKPETPDFGATLRGVEPVNETVVVEVLL
jgi:hypothetical protein